MSVLLEVPNSLGNITVTGKYVLQRAYVWQRNKNRQINVSE